MKHVNMKGDILSRPGLEKATHGIEVEPKPRHFTFNCKGTTVYVDSTSYKVTDALTRFDREHQVLIIIAIMSLVPEPGDAIILREDALCGQETAVVTRMRRDDGHVGLTFSR